MNYHETTHYLFSRLPMFQREGKAAYKADLGNTLLLDEHFNHPHRRFRTIHIAGTNGKGSVSHMLASVLQNAGYRVGLYTSPHLRDFRERIRINGAMIPEEAVVRFVRTNRSFFDTIKPSFFEITVAMAFDYFAREKVDLAVIEVGLGGRLDSTNIITPILSVITNISLDHTDLLGSTTEQIAREKAGIIKPGIPVIIGQTQPEIKQLFIDKARECSSEIRFADSLFTVLDSSFIDNNTQLIDIMHNGAVSHWELDLTGNYQLHNLPTVLTSIEKLSELGVRTNEQQIRLGLKSVKQTTGLLGRWQKIGDSPLVICDTGHNTEGIRFIVSQLAQTPHNKLRVVLGVVADKNIDAILKQLPREAFYYFTQASIPRALSHNDLRNKAAVFGLRGNSYSSVKEALNVARSEANSDDLIFIGGSTFIVAEVV